MCVCPVLGCAVLNPLLAMKAMQKGFFSTLISSKRRFAAAVVFVAPEATSTKKTEITVKLFFMGKIIPNAGGWCTRRLKIGPCGAFTERRRVSPPRGTRRRGADVCTRDGSTVRETRNLSRAIFLTKALESAHAYIELVKRPVAAHA